MARPGPVIGLFLVSLLTFSFLWVSSTGDSPAASAATNVTLKVDASQQVNPFRDTMRGVATNNWNQLFHGLWDRGNSPDGKFEAIVDATKRLEPGILRFGGGLWANRLGWDRSGNAPDDGAWTYRDPSTGQTYNYTHAYKPGLVDSYQTLRNQVGPNGGPALAIIQVNVCDNNIKMWQDLVRYANIEKGYNFEYWEIGNEQTLESCGLSASAYANRYANYQSALKAIDPSIKIMGPIAHQPYFNSWEDQLVNRMGQNLDTLTWHWYQLSEWTSNTGAFAYQGGSVEALLAHDGVVGSSCQSGFGCPGGSIASNGDSLGRWTYRRGIAEAKMDYIQDNYVAPGKVKPDMETAITEFGAHASGHEHPINSNHIAAVWLADMLPRWAYNGLDIVTYYSLEDGGNGGQTNSRGLIGTWGGSALDVRPIYYTEWLLANHFGDQMVKSSSSDPDQKVVVWATTDSDDPGKLKLMLVNLSGDTAAANLEVSGFTPQSGQAYVMTSDNPLSMANSGSFTNHSTKINGVRIPDYEYSNPSGFVNAINSINPVNVPVSNNFSYSIPPYAAVALELSGAGAPAPGPSPSPTPTPPAGPVSTDAALSVSTSPVRSGSVALDGGTVSGDVYVSVAPDTDVSTAAFFIDNQLMNGTPLRIESFSAYDLMGTAADGTALPWNTQQVPDGAHTVTVALTMRDGSTLVRNATFTVSNNSAPTPSPTPSPTQTPTQTPAQTPTQTPAQTPSPSPTPIPVSLVKALAGYNEDRTSQFDLNGSTVDGEIFVAAGPDADVGSVSFYIDNQSMAGAPLKTENITPFDLVGTHWTGIANAYNTGSLSDGEHTLTMKVTFTNGQEQVVNSKFTVGNGPSVILNAAYSTNRNNPFRLDGATLSGTVYIWATEVSGLSSVQFYLNDQSASGSPQQTENLTPFDFSGTHWTGIANGFNTASLGNGSHTITIRAIMNDGSEKIRHTSFVVNN